MQTLRVLFTTIILSVFLVSNSNSTDLRRWSDFSDDLQPGMQSAKGYRIEVLVYSSQTRLIKIALSGEEEIELITPAVTAKLDKFVPFNKEVSIPIIKINPLWNPTTSMQKEDPEKKLQPFRGGQPGNPLGAVAFYPKFHNLTFINLRIHEAPEIINRTLSKDEKGDLHGYRESHGCASISREDIIEYTNILTGIDQGIIRKIIASKKTRILKPKIPITLVFLSE